MVASKAARTRKLSSFVSKNKCRTVSLSAAFVFHFISLSLFSIPSRWILDSILSTRDKLRDGAELLNLCLLINPTRSPHEIFISLVPRLFALVNLQSLAFKESLKISLQTWKKLLCENVILAGLFRIVEIEMDQWW